MEKIMEKTQKGKANSIFGFVNTKRCFTAALISIVFFPVLLILSAFEPELAEYYMIPGAFFSAGSAAFAFLFHQIIRNKAKKYYEMSVWIYLTAFHLFFVYMAQENIIFYYAAVVLAAYAVFMTLDRYLLMAMAELVCYAAVIVKNGAQELPAGQILFLAGVHMFAFFMSRDFYAIKKNCIAEEKKLRREMQESEHDPLTGLVNRRGLERRVNAGLQTSINRQETVAALVMDIDLFKSYNDRFGHVQGDVCIKRVAQSIAETVKGYGIAARIGGEEFLVFVRGRSVQEIYNLAEQIRADVESLGISRGGSNAGVVTISIGIDIRYATPDVTLQGLYGRADQGLYQAKKDGRNCVRSIQMTRERRSRIG